MQAASRDDQWSGDCVQISDIPYMLPNFNQGVDRLDLQHYMIRYLLKGITSRQSRNQHIFWTLAVERDVG